MSKTITMAWDEPAGCTTPRGWLRVDGTCVGNYLDYGPGHYRSPHEYCQPDRLCPDCQPGTVHAVRYPGGPGSCGPHDSRYFETIAEARGWIETDAQDYADRTHIPGLTVSVVQAY